MPDADLNAEARWYVYLLECHPASIYTGIATDVAARIRKHIHGTGARYTRSHPPRRLMGVLACSSRSEAQRLEASVRKLTPAGKRELARQWCAEQPVCELTGIRELCFTSKART